MNALDKFKNIVMTEKEIKVLRKDSEWEETIQPVTEGERAKGLGQVAFGLDPQGKSWNGKGVWGGDNERGKELNKGACPCGEKPLCTVAGLLMPWLGQRGRQVG